MQLDYSKISEVELSNLTFDHDYWCDIYVESALYDGREMTEAECEALSEDADFMYEEIQKQLW